MDLEEYKRDKEKKLEEAIIINSLYSFAISVGFSFLIDNWIPLLISVLLIGYLFNKK